MANTPGQLVSSGKACLRDTPRQREIDPGHHESLVVDRDTILEPAGIGIGADEQEQMAERARVRLAVRAVAEGRTGKASYAVTFQADDLRPRVQRHVRQRLDALDQILRHRRLEPLPAYHEMQVLHLRREEHDSLTG